VATVSTILSPRHADFDPNISSPQLRRVNGTNFSRVVAAFDAALKETLFFVLAAVRWGSGSLTLKVRWSAASATSGNVVWEAKLAAITPDADSGSIQSKAFAAAQTVTDSHLGTNADRLHEATITVSNLDSLANNDMIVLSFARDAASGSDTMSGDAWLDHLILEWSDV
jgi:hypothetical protein